NNITYLLKGKQASYIDSNGDAVTLNLAKGGLMELIRFANGEGRFLTLTETVPGQSALKGTVTRKPGGDGLTNFVTVTGTSGVNLNSFTNPPFVVSNPISAMVVDRLLDSGETASELLADALSHKAHHRK